MDGGWVGGREEGKEWKGGGEGYVRYILKG